jgi:KDO2-lipid IV(A) lauroyltransferase
LGPEADAQVLEDKTRRVFYTALRGYFDLFRALQLSQEELASMVHVTEETKEVMRDLKGRPGGSVLVFPHLSAFDVGGIAITPYAPETQVFTLPDPPPGFQMLNELRQSVGASITPLSSAALRQALKLLRRGGTVSIAGDRPVSEQDEPIPFFGQPARVPSGHIRLALKTGAAVALCYCVFSPERETYVMHVEPPMEMIRTGNREREIRINMEQVLGGLEAIIRRWPEQWQMFVPVWPELLET